MSIISSDQTLSTSSSGEALYRQVEHYIEQLIRRDGLEPGDSLPSLAELSAAFGVNSLTVRRAIQELSARDVVVCQQGRGTYVSQGAVRQVLWVSSVNIFKKEVSAYYTDLLGKVSEILQEQGIRVEPVWIANDRPEDVQRYLKRNSLKTYAGYVFCACKLNHQLFEHVSESNRPRVLISQTSENSRWALACDHDQGDELALSKLASLGCKHVATVTFGSGQAANLQTIAKRHPMKLTHLVCPPDQDRMADVERLGMEMTLDLLDGETSKAGAGEHGASPQATPSQDTPPIDGWYFTDDVLARGATRAMLMRGLATHPPQIVVRCGNAQFFPHGLSVHYVAFDIQEQAQMAVQILLDQLEHRPGSTHFMSQYQHMETPDNSRPSPK